MPHRPIDLHTHSSVSDGTETPAELVAAAVSADLAVVALTDHDSTAGWAEATRAVAGTGLTLVPGMEMSTRLGMNSVHMLAYLFDPLNARLVTETARIRDGRLHRAESIVNRIAADYDLTWDDVLAQSIDGGTIGRPHIADALVARGYVANRSAAFESIPTGAAAITRSTTPRPRCAGSRWSSLPGECRCSPTRQPTGSTT